MLQDDIKPMDKASEAIVALKPVIFRYKKKFDPTHDSGYGLIASNHFYLTKIYFDGI